MNDILPIMLRQAVTMNTLQKRDDKSFFDKYKGLIIGGAVAVPLQLLGLWWYLRYRKAKKARQAMAMSNTETGTRARIGTRSRDVELAMSPQGSERGSGSTGAQNARRLK